MTTIATVPPFNQPQQQTRFTTSRIIFMGHQTSGIANVANTQVSAKLPNPCIITAMTWQQSAASSSAIQWAFNLYLSNNDSPGLDDASLGTRFSQRSSAGASPPDIAGLTDYDLAWPYATAVNWVPLWIPVLEPGMYVKSKAIQTVAAACRFWIYLVVGLLERAPLDPTAGIVPRGTRDEPVCVNICGYEPGVPSPAPPTGAPPLPTPPTPAPGPTIDPLQEPLPAPCNIHPEQPLLSTAYLCQVP